MKAVRMSAFSCQRRHPSFIDVKEQLLATTCLHVRFMFALTVYAILKGGS